MRGKREAVELYDGIKFTLPPLPPKEEIIGYDLPIKKQKWRRLELPKGFENWSATRKKPLVDMHWKYRWEGLWFMNNGTPTYITGKHFWYLNWSNTPDFGYPQFRDIDKRAYYMWELVEKDRNCYGLIRLKFRRLGATTQGESLETYYSTGYFRSYCGIVSKIEKDAAKSFNNCVKMVYSLPDFFVPNMKGKDRKDRPSKEVEFIAPAGADSTDGKNSLVSKFDFRSTTKNAYDGSKLKYILIDEGGKFEKIRFDEFWGVHKTCLVTGSVIRGKAYIPSTVNEFTEGNGDGYKIVWDRSNPEERDANGRTKSGLYRYFNPAYDGLEGYIDEYGMSIIDTPTREQTEWMKSEGIVPNPYIGAKEFLQNTREGLKNDPKELAEHKRQFPWTPEEAFRTEAKNCLFDSEKLYQRLEELESPLFNETYPFNLQWKNGVQDGEVEIIPTKAGRFVMGSVGIPIEFQNKIQRHKDAEGKVVRVVPLNTGKYVVGTDPYVQHKTTDKGGSMAAAHAKRLYDPIIDPFGKPIAHWETNRYVVEYLARPDNIFIYYEDMIMLCSLLGCLINVENDKPGLLHYFEQRGYYHCLMVRPEVTQTSNYTRQQTTPGTPASIMSATTGVNYIEAYVSADIYGAGAGHGHCCLIDFPRTILSWLKFEINNTTRYDLSMSTIYTELGEHRFVKRPKPKQNLDGIFATYNNKGMVSEYTGSDR